MASKISHNNYITQGYAHSPKYLRSDRFAQHYPDKRSAFWQADVRQMRRSTLSP